MFLNVSHIFKIVNMNIIYKWYIIQLLVKPNDGDLKDVVVICDWLYTASAIDNDKEYVKQKSGKQYFSDIDIKDFTPFEDLTYNQVCGWLESSIDVNLMNNELAIEINDEINPKIVYTALPFVNP